MRAYAICMRTINGHAIAAVKTIHVLIVVNIITNRNCIIKNVRTSHNLINTWLIILFLNSFLFLAEKESNMDN